MKDLCICQENNTMTKGLQCIIGRFTVSYCKFIVSCIGDSIYRNFEPRDGYLKYYAWAKPACSHVKVSG